MAESIEAWRIRRAEARREVLGRGDDYNGLTPAQAFNAAWELFDKPPVQYKPNHYYHDSLGDPATCTEDHNHPEE